MRHPLEVLGIGDLPLVDPLAVPVAAGTYLLDLAIGLLLVARQVVDDDPQVTRTVDDDRAALPKDCRAANSGRLRNWWRN
uniref:hypothetical protein n=1 Tax=Nocardioides alcanivorans TaxID=2897352 RepID=UPI001F3ACD6E|nr:hypothetical protein [Nocardioides alcanivorans]